MLMMARQLALYSTKTYTVLIVIRMWLKYRKSIPQLARLLDVMRTMILLDELKDEFSI
jgi:uncharacterized protein YjiS (DUF1127 family)